MLRATYVQHGNEVDYTPATAVLAGDVVVQGQLVGIARENIDAGKLGALAVSGIFDVAKASETIFDAGSLVYWDDTNKLAVAVEGSGTNKLMGKAIAAAGSGATSVRVRLSQ